jgi:DNA helicase II / ATP-dependent DNA helicase PcrA
VTLSTLSIIEGLNERQIEVVKRTIGPLLVVAGPGSGKTLAIVRRIAHLIQQAVPPESILAVTFTNRAAREMRERLRDLLGAASAKVFVGTLHLLGLTIIRENTTSGFVIYSREEQVELLGPLLQGSKAKAKDIADEISYVKSRAMGPSGNLKEVFERYQAAMMDQKAFDFDDLIIKPIEMLDNPELLIKYRDRFKHIIIDEYQDINPAQYKLLRLLAENSATICAVGDPDQAIYAFRGSDVENFLNFEKDFVGAAEVSLCLNYRSSGNIVCASEKMITHNTKRIDKELLAVKDDGPLIVVASVPDERAEGEFVAHEIESRFGGLSHYRLQTMSSGKDFSASSCCFSDFAVIFRTNNQAEAIKERLMESGIPCQVLGKRRAGSVTGKDDMVSSLRLFSNTMENRRKLFEMKALEFLQHFAKDINCGNDQLTELINHIKLMLGDAWTEATAGDIMNELNLLTPSDDFDPRAEAVVLMTLHMAKGLEFRVVFISGVEDGFMPYRTGRGSEDLEEERRLFYVGMTRAKEELFLIGKRSGFIYGRKSTRAPSSFLSEIPEEHIQRISVPDRPKRLQGKQQMKLF